MSAPVWRLEWALALRRRRLLLMNLGIPLLLVIPLATAGAPPFHAAAAYAVLFVLFGTFGSAIPLLREGDSGPLRRMLLAGTHPGGFLLQRVGAGTLLDLLQLLPALLLVLTAGAAPPGVWMAALPAVVLALLAANMVGFWVAALARSLAEGALFAAVASLFLLHASGVFRTAAPATAAALLEAVLPYGPLHAALLAAATGGASTAAPPAALLPPFLTTLGLFLASVLLSRFLLERISTVDG